VLVVLSLTCPLQTVFVPTDGLGGQAGNAMAIGLAAGMGRDQGK